MLIDPTVEYKMVEKIEMEDQKRNENKIQNKEQKVDMPEEKISQKPVSEKEGGAVGGTGQPKKKKTVFDDVRNYESVYRNLQDSVEEQTRKNEGK